MTTTAATLDAVAAKLAELAGLVAGLTKAVQALAEQRAEQPITKRGDLTTKEACDYLGVSKPTLYSWARTRCAKRVKVGKLVRWPRKELDGMVDRSMRTVR
jgi:excisionase family DNA binding protein